MNRFLLFLLALGLLLPVNALADDTVYTPADHTIELTRPATGITTASYILTITSPSRLAGTATMPASVITDVKIESIAVPQDSANNPLVSSAAALALVGVDPETLTFTALNQAKTVTVGVEIDSATVPGDYVYSIVSKKPATAPNGWGNAAATFTLSVVVPVVVDVTPPSVTITAPANLATFTYCPSSPAQVSLAFTATDAQSVITAVAASAQGSAITPLATSGLNTNNTSSTGSFGASVFGKTTVSASAQSAGGLGYDSKEIFTTYVTTWLPPVSLGKTSKSGSTIPLKFTARDCDGNFVVNQNVKVEIRETTGDSNTLVRTAVLGSSSTDVRIDSEAEHYIVNFQTGSGVRSYRAEVLFADGDGNWVSHGSTSFAVR